MILVFVLSLVSASPAPAQSQLAQLTPEQQRLLSQLPPAQRQALLARYLGNGRQSAQTRDDSADTAPDSIDFEAEPAASDEDEIPVFEPEDHLLVLLKLKEELPPDVDLEEVEDVESRLELRNPYRLDDEGRLSLPGERAITIAGLTEELATQLVASVQSLGAFDVEVLRLPLQPFGVEALEPYGYETLRRDKRRMPETDGIPVPSDYILGPGDVLRVQLYGNQSAFYELEVDRDGVVAFPDLGPVTVSGLSFDAVRTEINQRVSEQLIGVNVSLTLSELRSIQVFLAGDVEMPGSYQLSAMSTILDVLLAGGGIADTGSLRLVQLKRSGNTVVTFDLYQLLLFGDSSRNRRVLPGDVVFVPPVGAQVTVAGAVRRPAIYEIRESLNVAGALQLAGGRQSGAYLAGARLERRDPKSGLAVERVDLTESAGRATRLQDGDVLMIPEDTDRLDKAVTLYGHVYRPGIYEWRQGLLVGDIIDSPYDLLPDADQNYVLIRRQHDVTNRVSFISANLERVWSDSGARQRQVQLEPRDEIYVFAREDGREIFLDNLLKDLRQQASASAPTPVVRVGGFVNAPGEYPLEPDMTVADLIRAGGGLAESAYTREAELSRYSTDGQSARETLLLEIDLASVIAGDETADIRLQPFDYLNVKQITRWQEEEIVEILGEVAFPGRYPIYRGETLSSVVARAGGLTEFAFPEGSVFTRETLKEREQEQLETLANRIESDLATLALSDTAQTEALSIGRSLLDQIENSEPAGRLVIDLSRVLSTSGDQDIFARDGDMLIVPPVSQEVTVIGEVQYATSHLWEKGINRDEYIRRSGGVTVKADEPRIYVVRANGEVVVNNRSRFFSRSRGFDIRPGDTIVVPLDTDRVKPLVLWSSATQILYNLAIAAAAVNSF